MKGLIVLAAVLLAAPALGQPVHGHPQKTAYASPAEWPTDSAQCHWSPSDNPPGSMVGPSTADLRLGLSGTAMIGHTHIDLKFPRYAELSQPITVAFTIKAFHFAGVINQAEAWTRFGQLDTGSGVNRPASDWVWDETHSSTPPVMRGDPMGLKQWTGHFTAYPSPYHGWFNVGFSVFTQFDNGDAIKNFLFEPVFSMTAGPETGERSELATQCFAASPRRPEVDNGSTSLSVVSLLPIAPVSQWPAIQADSVGYGSSKAFTEPALLQERIDPDLHSGIAGRMIVSHAGFEPRANAVSIPLDLSAGTLGAGPHKVALIRTQPDGGMEGVAVLFVFDIVSDPNAPAVVDPNPPPPPPPPIVTPPPPPPPVKACTGTVAGTSVDGATVTVTGGTIVCKG